MGELNVLVVQKPGEISFNVEDLKAAVAEKVSFYSGLVVQEETIPGAKKDLAELRKLKDDLDTRRKAAKRLWMEPYDAFEAQLKEVIGEVEKPIKAIDQQLKDFEADRVAKKQVHLRELYNAEIGDYAEFLPFESVKRPQWNNKTATDQDVRYDIQEAVAKVSSEVSAIKALESEIEDKLLKVYKANGNNLTAAISENINYLETRKRAEENLRAELERKAKEAEKAPAPQAKTEETTVSDADLQEKSQNSDLKTPKDDFINPPEPGFWIGVFDETALEDIRAYCEFNEIQYKKEVR